MRKLLPISALMLMFLTGCTSANKEIILSDNTANNTLEAEAFSSQEDSGKETETPETLDNEPPENVVVYVCGAVVNPGVYELSEGSRIDDALAAAGGFSEDADRTYVNLAARLSDGSKLQIPTISETSDEALAKEIESFDTGDNGYKSGASDGSGLININTASQTELATLPGIGEGIAGKIIKYRDENGSFKSIEDIMKVSGIKDKLFSKIKDQITV
ncbi:MAG: helix-hairpin-helix domain-containing protein [Butyrivibrio sp.]|nr:helix-hairpin-helix domain-containing protein [Butyrivibrio sp.]